MPTNRVFNSAKLLVLVAYFVSGGVSLTTIAGIAGIVTTVIGTDQKAVFGVDGMVNANAPKLPKNIVAASADIHPDNYHMNIEDKGAGYSKLDAREHLRYIYLSENDRGTPGQGCCDWDEIHTALAAIGCKGGVTRESFINMSPEIAYGLESGYVHI